MEMSLKKQQQQKLSCVTFEWQRRLIALPPSLMVLILSLSLWYFLFSLPVSRSLKMAGCERESIGKRATLIPSLVPTVHQSRSWNRRESEGRRVRMKRMVREARCLRRESTPVSGSPVANIHAAGSDRKNFSSAPRVEHSSLTGSFLLFCSSFSCQMWVSDATAKTCEELTRSKRRSKHYPLIDRVSQWIVVSVEAWIASDFCLSHANQHSYNSLLLQQPPSHRSPGL